jgi:hypothetical protein
VTFARGLNPEEGASLIDLLGDPRITEIDDARSFLDVRRVERIALAETSMLDEAGDETRNKENRARARESYDSGVGAMRDMESQA